MRCPETLPYRHGDPWTTQWFTGAHPILQPGNYTSRRLGAAPTLIERAETSRRFAAWLYRTWDGAALR